MPLGTVGGSVNCNSTRLFDDGELVLEDDCWLEDCEGGSEELGIEVCVVVEFEPWLVPDVREVPAPT